MPRTVPVRMPSVPSWVDFFRQWFGPTTKAFEFVGPDGEAALTADLTAVGEKWNIGGGDALVFPQAYLDVVIRP